MIKKAIVYHHGNCPDGVFAAAIAKTALGQQGYEVQTVPKKYDGSPIEEELEGCEVFVLDYCFSVDEHKMLRSRAASVVVLDHHKTALENFKGQFTDERAIETERSLKTMSRNHTFCVDCSKCGASLAWNYFHPGQVTPRLITHIEDRDIWTWAHPDSKAFLQALDQRMIEPGLPAKEAFYHNVDRACEWLQILVFDNDRRDQEYLRILEEGKALLKAFEAEVARVVSEAKPVKFEGFDTFLVHCPSEFVSEACNRLAKKSGTFAMAYYEMDKDRVKLSFRSLSSFVCRTLAEKYGGGGHDQASAAVIGIDQFKTLFNR